MADQEDSKNDIELDLAGRTLRVYWYMLQNKEPLGRLEIQRGTKLSSASLAEYHLRKLIGMGLVEKNIYGEYVISRTVQVGVMRFYMIFRSNMIPRFLLYISFYISILIALLVFFNNIPQSIMFLIVTILAFGIISSLIESVILWKTSPT
ncbi:MAG: hypothetical protein ACFFDR_12385 [Candidatus Thorarchaeota archaeon]